MKRCVLYARVSTEKQVEKGLSIPAQIDIMKQYAQGRGWTVARVFKDEGKTGRNTNRPALQEMLKFCELDGSIDVVLVHKLDRLSRSVVDTERLIVDLEDGGIHFDAAAESFDTSPMGRANRRMASIWGQLYVENLAEETKKGLKRSIQEGMWPHKAPVGYKNIPAANGKKRQIVPSEHASAVQHAFELYATGRYSLQTVGHAIAELGLVTRKGKPYSISRVKRVLVNPFYSGRMLWKGKIYEGVHKPIVSHALFERVQRQCAERSRTRPRRGRYTFLLRGLVYCGDCGLPMTCDTTSGYRYYRCWERAWDRRNCPSRMVSEATIDTETLDYYRRVQFRQDEAVRLVQESKKTENERRRSTQSRLTGLRRRLDVLAGKIQSASDKLCSGTLPDEAYHSLMDEYRPRQDALRRKVGEAEAGLAAEAPIDQMTEDLLRLVQSPLDLHEVLSKDQQARLAQCLFKRVWVKDQHVFTVEPTDVINRLLGLKLVTLDEPTSIEAAKGYTFEKLLAEKDVLDKGERCPSTLLDSLSIGDEEPVYGFLKDDQILPLLRVLHPATVIA